MISRISSAAMTRAWMRIERANEVRSESNFTSVEMFANAGDEEPENSPDYNP